MEEHKTDKIEIILKENEKYSLRIPVSIESETVIYIEHLNERNS